MGLLHAEVRQRLWGYAEEHLSNEQLIREKYHGIRPAPGYPACPDHSLKPILFEMFGGSPGASGMTLVRPAGDERFRTVRELYGTASNTKFSGLKLQQGDQVLIRSAGGGGYGDPLERDAELLAEDVAEGFVTPQVAAEAYGR